MSAVVTIGLLATVASAGAAPDEAPGRARLEATLHRADAALDRATSAGEQAQLQAIRGQVLLALGRTEKAKAAFMAALRKEPAIELDAVRASPEALRLLDGARRELPAMVSVVIKAGSGSVIIDERDLGPAPLQTQLPGGLHQLQVRAKTANGRVNRFEAQISPGRRVTLELELDKTGSARARAESPPRRVTEQWAPSLVATMELADEPEPSVPPAVAVVPEPPRPVERPHLPWVYAVGGLGVALVGSAACFGVATLEEARAARAAVVSTDLHALHAGQARSFALISDVLYGAGAVAAVAAIWLFLSDGLPAPATTLGLVPVPIPGGAAISFVSIF